jgi:16S rRNA (cytosine967-C5)-methyltransferase
LLEVYSRPSSLSVTVNEGKISRDGLIRKLADLGYKCLPSRYSANGVSFEESLPPKSIEGFSEGEFFVQDEASRIAAAALDARLGETVIDVCSAPGGKALAAAIKVGKEGRVYAFDLHESKLSLINESTLRLGLDNVTVRSLDATKGCEELFGEADKVICDVPCSGLGVFGKKPDLRYKDIDEAKELPPLQSEILKKSAEYLKPGGVIVYSTCTLNPEENEGVTDSFIRDNPGFTYEDFEVSDLKCKGKITLLPHIHGTDGFYIAKLRKLK